MTVCIAAIASDPTRTNPYIVTASDTMIQGSTFAPDANTVKSEPFHPDWTAMMASDDLAQCVPIIDKAQEYFKNRKNTLAVARSVFKRAYQRHLAEMREDAVLSGYKMTCEDFAKHGKRRFTERTYEDLRARMEAIEPKSEFLVFGFDSTKRPHIFCVEGVGTDRVLDKPGFCAIGSGKWAADAILFYLEQSIDKTLEETIFNVCAAKFAAERYGVGKHTYLFVKRRGSIMFSWKSGMLEDIRKAWEEKGAPRVPAGVIEAIKQRSALLAGLTEQCHYILNRP